MEYEKIAFRAKVLQSTSFLIRNDFSNCNSVAFIKLLYQDRSGDARSAPWTKKEYISKILNGIGGGKDETTKQLTTIYISPLGRIHSEGKQQQQHQQNRLSIGKIIIHTQPVWVYHLK